MTSDYGIKVLWAGWQNEPYFGFSAQGYKQWGNNIEIGSHMLLYESLKPRPGHNRGIQSIMAEVEVVTGFDEVTDVVAPTVEHEHLIGVKVLRLRGSVNPIPLDHIRQIIQKSSFPSGFTYWRLTAAEYTNLLKEWDR